MFCPYCKQTISQSLTKCPGCKSALTWQDDDEYIRVEPDGSSNHQYFCTRCGTPVTSSMKSCPKCKNEILWVRMNAAATPPKKSKAKYALLPLLFIVAFLLPTGVASLVNQVKGSGVDGTETLAAYVEAKTPAVDETPDSSTPEITQITPDVAAPETDSPNPVNTELIETSTVTPNHTPSVAVSPDTPLNETANHFALTISPNASAKASGTIENDTVDPLEGVEYESDDISLYDEAYYENYAQNMEISILMGEKLIVGKYSGEVKDGVPCGWGDFRYDTIICTHNMITGEISDERTVEICYAGEFDGDQFVGVINELFDGELAYRGEFKNGRRHGYGHLYAERLKVIYEGEFRDGLPNGRGKLYQDGKVYYEGPFENGVISAKLPEWFS